MISAETMAYLEAEKIPYILGARMRKSKEVKEEVLSRAGRYREVHTEGVSAKDPSPMKVKEVIVDGNRYIVCLNEKQARKDAADRQAIIDSLVEKLKNNPKSLVGNKGYRKYLKLDRETIAVNQEKIEEDARYDGKWVQDEHHADGRAGGPQVQGTLAGRAGLPGHEVGSGYQAHLPLAG
jgi:hypothetical protein